MGLDLSLYTILQVARISVPTVAESFVGRVTRERCDRRIKAFGQRVVKKSRMRLEVVGLERVPRDRAFIYMSNHQSQLDIPVLFATVPAKTLRMVAKTELFRVPIFGPALKAAGFVEVDRQNRERAISSLGRAGKQIADGVSIWISPEGSRSTTGEVASLKKGGFHLALDTETPIVPVALSGTYNILPPHTRSMAYDVPVKVVFGEPIPVVDREIESLMDEISGFFAANVEPVA